MRSPESTARHPAPDVRSAARDTRRLIRTGVITGAIAAVGTTLIAALARAAEVSLDVDGQPIPIPAFAMWTVVATALGVVLARLVHDRRRFVTVTALATSASLIPAIVAPDHAATKVVLVAAHLLAAAIVIPTLGATLATSPVEDR